MLRHRAHERCPDFHDRIVNNPGFEAWITSGRLPAIQDGEVDMLVNGDPADAFSRNCSATLELNVRRPGCQAERGIPRQQSPKPPSRPPLAALSLMKSSVPHERRDGRAGGDISRKHKLEKQKEGKKRMKSIGSVKSPDAHQGAQGMNKNGPSQTISPLS